MTNEKDREEAQIIFDNMLNKTCAFGSGSFSEDEYVEILEVLADNVSRIRAEAVKAERERCAALARRKVWEWKMTRTVPGIDEDELYNTILSDDQKRPKRSLVEVFAEIRREYGADFDRMFPTSEPEPCEDDYVAYMRYSTNEGKPTSIAACDSWDEGAFRVYRHPHASQVADKRAEELRAQVETLREFVSEAVQWSEAYPEHIFTAPTPEQVDAVCKTLGFRIDRIAAMVLREFTGRWSDKARALLAATEPKT